MKMVRRLVLAAVAGACGGLLGWALLTGFSPERMALFAVACTALGQLFFRLDQQFPAKITRKNPPAGAEGFVFRLFNRG